MPIPGFQTFLLPLLELAGDGMEHSLGEARSVVAKRFGLADQELAELLPSGRQRRFDNRVAWAKVYLERAGLLTSLGRARFIVTEEGQKLLATKPARVDVRLLTRYDAFRSFHRSGRKADQEDSTDEPERIAQIETPEEVLEASYQSIKTELAAEVLTRVKAASPAFFERLVVEVLLAMGYGSSRAEAGKAIGGVGDEGIDGIISEDRLGLDVIYIQAKRWEGRVGRPEIQKFVGALHGKHARKGIFITTGSFSEKARQYVASIDPRVVLIDGPALAEYMVDLNVGVSTRLSYELKRIDSDYFVEE